uniref:Uncharacterized protein n=2 Tax=unclassified Inovirus TaxID=356623 RepID=A0AAU8AXW8_9VIRU
MKRLISLVLVAALSFFSFVCYADSASVLDWSVNKGDNVKPDDYYSGRSFDFVQHPGVFDATYPLSQTIDFTHPAHVGYTTFKNWFYSTGNSTPYTLRGWIRYYGPDIQVRWSTGSSAGSYSSLSMSSGSQNGGCVYSSSTSDWYDRIKVTIQPTFILPDQDYYLTVAGNALGSFFSPVADDSSFVFKQLSQVKYSDTQFICTYAVRNTSTETKKLTSVEFSTSSNGGFTLSSFTVSPYSSSSEDVIAAIQKQTNDIIDNQNQHYQDTENKFQGAVNPGQAGANQEIQDNVGQLEDFDNKIFTDVSDYTSQLDFGLGDWSEAAAGISYIGSIFMLIWDNSPTQVIVLSLMVGLCLLILGRGPRVAGEVRRHEERASRRKKGG